MLYAKSRQEQGNNKQQIQEHEAKIQKTGGSSNNEKAIASGKRQKTIERTCKRVAGNLYSQDWHMNV